MLLGQLFYLQLQQKDQPYSYLDTVEDTNL